MGVRRRYRGFRSSDGTTLNRQRLIVEERRRCYGWIVNRSRIGERIVVYITEVERHVNRCRHVRSQGHGRDALNHMRRGIAKHSDYKGGVCRTSACIERGNDDVCSAFCSRNEDDIQTVVRHLREHDRVIVRGRLVAQYLITCVIVCKRTNQRNFLRGIARP